MSIISQKTHIQSKKDYDSIITNILNKSKPNNSKTNPTEDTSTNRHLKSVNGSGIINQKKLFASRLYHNQSKPNNKTELSNCSLRLTLTNKTSFYKPNLKSKLTKDILDGLSLRLTKKNIFKDRRNTHLLQKSQINSTSFLYQGKGMDSDLEKVAKDLNEITAKLNKDSYINAICSGSNRTLKENSKTGCHISSNHSLLTQIRIKSKNKALIVY